MSETPHTFCAIQGCKTTLSNKGASAVLHSLPTNFEMRSKWLSFIKDKCYTLEMDRSKICSKHFENKYYDSLRRLRENAIPTIFPTTIINQSINMTANAHTPRTKVDRLLNRLTQAQLTDNIKSTMRLIKVPSNFSNCVDDDLRCVPDTPVEAQLWLLIKKQDHLITRLSQAAIQNKKHVEVLQKNIEESRAAKKAVEHSVESYKYIVKCLQEKHTTLEEQIEILTAVESR